MERNVALDRKETNVVQVGIFWVIPDKIFGQSVLEFRKRCYATSEADTNGFVNYPYSHYETWDSEVRGLGSDCYKYPRGRVLYDVNANRHRIFADECVLPSTIDEVVQLFGIQHYELCRDEHYVCAFCAHKRKQPTVTLQYNVLRGQNKIGENLIEITYGDTKLLVELGKALDGNGEQFEQELLQRTDYSAVFVSHYHEDHAGLIKYYRNCPVYIGGGGYRVLAATYDYRGEQLPENVKTYRGGRPISVGGIRVTPFRCDHSAFDSYMLLFEAGGKSILYTGDFRFHGRMDKSRLLAALPKALDVLIHEGTNLGNDKPCFSETELEDKLVEVFKQNDKPIFVMQSATNIDRLVSVYRAAKRSGRILYEDNYTALVASAAGGKIPRPDVFNDVYAFTPRLLHGKRKDMFFEFENKRGLKAIANGKKFVMIVRPSMIKYMEKLYNALYLQGATLVYSMWSGYKNDAETDKFLKQATDMFMKIVDLHTSGHASPADIELLKQTVNAKQTVCVHTEFNV